VAGLKLRVLLHGATLDLTLTVSRIGELLPHEEVIPDYLETLERAFRVSVYQRNPIIVDERSMVILDGTHRWAVMRKMGYKWIATCLVDYRNPSIRVGRWIRAFRSKSIVDVKPLLREFGGIEVKCPNEIRERDLAIIWCGKAYKVHYEHIEEAYSLLKNLEGEVSKLLDSRPTYIPDIVSLNAGCRDELLLLPPILSKEEVVRIALKGVLLPPKSTRHVIPARPLGINIPLKLLAKSRIDVESLEGILKQRMPVMVKTPIILERKYEEIVLYFM